MTLGAGKEKGGEPLLIVGAGPAGLALGIHYEGRSRIIERDAEVGGLCRSIEFGGGLFDIGGHSFHTPHADVRAFVESLMHGNWASQPRDARVFHGGELIPYPFQAHFEALSDPAVVADCRAVPVGAEGAEDFEQWIVGRFGEGVAEHFMLPYNRKLWARDLTRMSCEWVGERVAPAKDDPKTDGPKADGASMSGGKRKPLHSESHVAYPVEGGFGAIFEAMARLCPAIEHDTEIVRIDPVRRTAVAHDGRTWQWQRLASTMPLPLLLRAVEGTPPALQAQADRLETVALRVLMILVDDPLPDTPQRVYVADPAVPPHKVAFNHTSSPALRRRPVHAIMCEISHSPDKPLAPDAELESATVGWLRAAGLLPPHAAVAEVRHYDVPYGYPVYTHDRPSIVAEIRSWLEPRGIFTLGRFGAWDYANSDECIRQGMALARRLTSEA